MSVVKARLRSSRKGKDYMGHDITSLDLRVLEDGVTIAVAAFLNGEIDELLLNGVIAVDLADHILDLNPIGSYVLHRRSSYLARNIGQVLYSPQSFLCSPFTEIIEDDSRSDRHQDYPRCVFSPCIRRIDTFRRCVSCAELAFPHPRVGSRARWQTVQWTFVASSLRQQGWQWTHGVGGDQWSTLTLVQNFNKVDSGMQDSTFEIICKKKVAATSDMQYRTSQLLKLDIHKIRYRIIFHETARLHLHSEGVHLRQILIIFRPYHSVFRSPVKPGMTGD